MGKIARSSARNFDGRRVCTALMLGVIPLVAHAADGTVEFSRDVAPILEKHCVQCHLPGNAQGDVSLATSANLRENEYLMPGDPDASYLVELISALPGERPAMPKEGDSLTNEQVAMIRRWIAQGANWPAGVTLRERSKAGESWWSLQPLQRFDELSLATGVLPHSVTSVSPIGQANQIDSFVFAKLVEADLHPNPPADHRTLIRRATYDLTGLPPAPTAVESFVTNSDPIAYEKLVDRLLASPHYGERWGRHWLDVVRFGESNGYERNFIINDLWPFRDYVIRSWNEDKPFDQFIREQLAGDVIGSDHPEVEIGSAFLVAGPFDDVGNQDPVQAAQIRANALDEIIRTTSGAFLGLTTGCARCHDHKFDPILQRDYYSLYATFAGIRHGSRPLATPEERMSRQERLRPLEQQRNVLAAQRDAILQTVNARADQNAANHEKLWIRAPANRQRTEEKFSAVEAKFIRLISEGQDLDPTDTTRFGIDELEAWSAEAKPRNVALDSLGGRASGASRIIEDFPGAYGPHRAIDGKLSARFLATGGQLTIEFAAATRIDRVVFSSARGETDSNQPGFRFVCEYRIEGSLDGDTWTEIANSHDRQPVNDAHRNKRLRELEITEEEKTQLAALDAQLAAVNRSIAAIRPLPTVWIGSRDATSAQGPFHIFVGGSPVRQGDEVTPASLAVLGGVVPSYALAGDSAESARRLALADWIAHPDNPLTPRVLANRLWHYHFGIGIVDTPSDFGYMGGPPTHPKLLDWLASQIHSYGWQIKPLQRQMMLSVAYRQSSEYRERAASVDGDARLLWRFRPRRLSAEEIRDTLLMTADQLDCRMGGQGFRLYRFLQDNVATYVPLDEHGTETYRRAVYHHNVRASAVDLMTDFDQPDCAFSTPRRSETTTPLQALTMLNHHFTIDMAASLVKRLEREAGEEPSAQIRQAFQLGFARQPTDAELAACRELVGQHGLAALARVLLNTSEMIFVQ